jgi:DNA-binding NarL/FixJ family response regulator
LFVADDHPAVRASLVAFLDAEDGIDVVGEARNGIEAVALCETLEPTVVLMDVRMPVLDGIGAAALIKRARPATRVVLVTAYEEPDLAAAGHECSADALVYKGVVGAELAQLLRTVAASASNLAEEAA